MKMTKNFVVIRMIKISAKCIHDVVLFHNSVHKKKKNGWP